MTRMFSRHPRQPARPHRLGRLTTAALVATGLTTAGAVAIGAAPAYALGPGQVCMVNQPNGAPSSGGALGHVGWMFMVGGSTTWVAGSTDGAVSSTNSKKLLWQRSGTKSALLDFFYADGYAKLRCHSTSTSAVGAANAMIARRDAQGFDTLFDNCLEDTVAIFNAYDSSMKLASGEEEGPTSTSTTSAASGPSTS